MTRFLEMMHQVSKKILFTNRYRNILMMEVTMLMMVKIMIMIIMTVMMLMRMMIMTMIIAMTNSSNFIFQRYALNWLTYPHPPPPPPSFSSRCHSDLFTKLLLPKFDPNRELVFSCWRIVQQASEQTTNNVNVSCSCLALICHIAIASAMTITGFWTQSHQRV